jgi:VIT1/CCC1 family predicted Fe2+/Mn2+ transporter
VDDYLYVPQDAVPYGYPDYGSYPDGSGGYPDAAGDQGGPVGRHRGAGQPDSGWRDQGRPQGNGGPRRGYPPTGGMPAQGYQPNPGQVGPGQLGPGQPSLGQLGPGPTGRRSGPQPVYPRGSGPQQAYRRDSGPQPAYRRDSGPQQTYRRDSGPQPAYQRGSGPVTAYRQDSGPQPAYRGASGPQPAYQPTDTMLLSGPAPDSGPMPAYREPSGDQALSSLKSLGKRVPGWLPYSNRLLLLPPDLEFDPTGESLREHRDVNGGWLRPAVFGAMDGLVTNSSLIAGIGGGGGGHGMIVLTGIAGLIAGAFSMATGEYISVKSQNELNLAEVELERRQHRRDPEGKRTRLTEIYVEKGVSPNLAEAVVRQISADRERAVAAHAREELGIDPDDLPSPYTAAVASFASFTVGALLPLSPFLAGYPNLKLALALAGASAFAGGAAVAKLTGRSSLLGGARQFTAAFMATGMAFLIGHLIGGHVSG